MRKKFLYKGICLVLTVATIRSVTGCSVKLNTSDLAGLDKLAKKIASFAQDVETKAELSEMLDVIEKEENVEFQEATLVRVVDGDTLVVSVNGKEEKVRLIGVNTPESVAPDSYRTKNTKEGVIASEYVKELLKNTTTLYLENDTSDTDKYGRLLRYVWLELPEDKNNVNEIATKMLNGLLVMDNVAEVATYEPDTRCQLPIT